MRFEFWHVQIVQKWKKNVFLGIFKMCMLCIERIIWFRKKFELLNLIELITFSNRFAIWSTIHAKYICFKYVSIQSIQIAILWWKKKSIHVFSSITLNKNCNSFNKKKSLLIICLGSSWSHFFSNVTTNKANRISNRISTTWKNYCKLLFNR